MDSLRCRTCGHTPLQPYSVKEMMYGTGGVYAYGLCPACGCMQIREIPADMSTHYPAGYYSMERLALKSVTGLATSLRRARLSRYLASPLNLELFWRLLLGGQEFFPWLKTAGLGPKAKVLDVGSGSGYFLRNLYNFGFKDLTGIDPFLPQDIDYAPGFKVLRQAIQDHHGSYDLITLNHALEHVQDPVATLQACRKLLAPGGTVLVRVPVMGKRAWELYGTDWAQLDAPRHFWIPSEAGLKLVAEKAGLELQQVTYDSHALQFWASEQYRRGVSLWDKQSCLVNREASGFSRLRILAYRLWSKWLNARRQGDQACFYLGAQALPGSSTSRKP